MQTENELIWHADGHSISLRIEKSNLVVTGIECPHAESGPCYVGNDGCAVKWFLMRFGLECNVGVCEPASVIQIAWALVGEKNLGMDACQIWFIPTQDEFFAAWAASQNP